MSSLARRLDTVTSLVPQQAALDVLPDWAKAKAQERLALIAPALQKVQQGVSVRCAAEWLMASGADDLVPSLPTLQRYLRAALTGDLVQLAPAHKGRMRKEYGWELRAQFYYNKPNNTSAATIAIWLQDEGHESATADRVRRYLDALPAQLGKYSPARVGPHTHRINLAAYKPRHTNNLPVGLVYQGDGHTVDAYLAHPGTGNIFRPELIAWIDVASRYIVGWWLCEDESQVDIVHSLAHAFTMQNHMPGMLHTDNGKFKDRMMTDEVAGYYAGQGIELMKSIPGNPRGKGHIERWFGTLRERFDKRFSSYCGDDMAPDANRKIHLDVKAGRREVPSVEQYRAELAIFIERYNRTPHSALDGKCPLDLWRSLERCELVGDITATLRPRMLRKVRNYMVSLDGRMYRSPELAAWNMREVVVEYGLRDDSSVRILQADGRWICDAPLVQRQPYLSDSRIEDLKQKRVKAQLKRLDVHREEMVRRAGMEITNEDIVDGLERFGALDAIQAPEEKEVDGLPPLDLTSTDY